MKVLELWRYPVKSMGGERLRAVSVGDMGVAGDRAWALRQGDITRNAKKYPVLMDIHATYGDDSGLAEPGVPTITLRDGSQFLANDRDASARLSGIVGDEVVLTPTAPSSDLEFYRRRERRSLQETRSIFGLDAGEPLPDVSKFPPRVAEFATPPGTFFDCYPILVMTTASLAALQAAAPTSRIDVRRFRPNILVESDEQGFVEAGWTGKKLKLGNVMLSLEVPCPRCVMTTVGFDDLPRDTAIMRTLVRECHHELGVYAEVVEPGEVTVGDSVSLVD